MRESVGHGASSVLSGCAGCLGQNLRRPGASVPGEPGFPLQSKIVGPPGRCADRGGAGPFPTALPAALRAAAFWGARSTSITTGVGASVPMLVSLASRPRGHPVDEGTGSTFPEQDRVPPRFLRKYTLRVSGWFRLH